MDEIQEILKSYVPISLQEMDGVALMNRTDTKYMISKSELMDVLKDVASHYRILDIKGVRNNHYRSQYYDTPEFYFYKRHHSGKKNRLKVRKRLYVESNLTFLEVKFKSNKGRTEKDRMKLGELNSELTEENVHYISDTSHFEDTLEPKLMNFFERITLVDQALPERITIDLSLGFEMGNRQLVIPDLVIIEAKQERQNRHSVFLNALKKRLIRPESISKYCLGVALMTDEKSNMFKEKIRRINKITNGNYQYNH
ncbi:MAG: polyphosphate polymerase domain-containing protein [Bacteroidetes bacterium]|nr:polyphosphate polymerase domain-containing protein [Bacteroidota bacterium]